MRVAFHIPVKVNDDRYIGTLEYVERAFAGYFGGFTETPALGGWVMRTSGILVKEPIRIVEGYDCEDFSNDERGREVGEFLYDLSNEVLYALPEEEAIMYTIDNKCYLTYRE